jgi:hypothetical protein
MEDELEQEDQAWQEGYTGDKLPENDNVITLPNFLDGDLEMAEDSQDAPDDDEDMELDSPSLRGEEDPSESMDKGGNASDGKICLDFGEDDAFLQKPAEAEASPE